MLTTIATDSNGNALLDASGNLSLLTNAAACALSCTQAMQTRLNECVYDLSYGVPYFQTIFVSESALPQFNAGAQAQLLNVPGVVSVLDFTSQVTGNTVQYSATIASQWGVFALA